MGNKSFKWAVKQEERLRELAEDKGISVTEMLRRILDAYLEGLDKNAGKIK